MLFLFCNNIYSTGLYDIIGRTVLNFFFVFFLLLFYEYYLFMILCIFVFFFRYIIRHIEALQQLKHQKEINI